MTQEATSVWRGSHTVRITVQCFPLLVGNAAILRPWDTFLDWLFCSTTLRPCLSCIHFTNSLSPDPAVWGQSQAYTLEKGLYLLGDSLLVSIHHIEAATAPGFPWMLMLSALILSPSSFLPSPSAPFCWWPRSIAHSISPLRPVQSGVVFLGLSNRWARWVS